MIVTGRVRGLFIDVPQTRSAGPARRKITTNGRNSPNRRTIHVRLSSAAALHIYPLYLFSIYVH
jgi:hypothetical protein